MPTNQPVHPAPEPPPLTLTIRDPLGQTRREVLSPGVCVIGRGEDACLLLDRPTVSRKHAEVSCRPDGSWQVRDLGSRAGTTLNGEMLREPCALSPGDVIGISRFELAVDHPMAPSKRPGSGSLEQVEDQSQISVLTNVAPPKVDTSHLTQLSDFGKRLIDIPGPQDRLDALCRVMAGQIIRARWVMALRLDGDDPSRPPEHLAVYPPDTTKRDDVHLSRSAIRASQESGAPVLASNFESNTVAVEMSVVSQQPDTAVVVCPLTEEPGSREVLYVNLPPGFGSIEWLVLIALAVKQYQQAEAAWGLREATRKQAEIMKELENARLIQRSILPAPRAVDGVALAWSFEPCTQVGGDILDVMRLADGRVLLVVADVTGHGLPAALATLAVHSIIHTAVRTGVALPEMMSLLNVHLCDYLPANRFVTMVCLAVDPASGDVEYLNAGHHGPTVFQASGEARRWPDGEHLPLGIDKFEFDATRQTLGPGETLLLSTDGLIELPLSDGQLLGRDGSDRLVGQTLTDETDLQAAVGNVRESLTRLRDGDSVDDETFMLVRRD